MSQTRTHRRLPARLRRDLLTHPVNHLERQTTDACDFFLQQRHEQWWVKRDDTGDFVDENFFRMLSLSTCLAEGKSQLTAVEEKVYDFVPFTKVLSVRVPGPAIDDGQIRRLPVLPMLPLKDYRVSTVVEFVLQA